MTKAHETGSKPALYRWLEGDLDKHISITDRVFLLSEADSLLLSTAERWALAKQAHCAHLHETSLSGGYEWSFDAEVGLWGCGDVYFTPCSRSLSPIHHSHIIVGLMALKASLR